MEINTQFYTTTQEDISGRAGMKRFSKTLKAMITDGELPVNSEWDMSISPFAINPRKHPEADYACDLINKCWLFPDINNITGISNDTPPREDMVLKPHIYARQIYYPFMMYSGDGGQGTGWAFPYYPARVGYDQTNAGDFTNYKWNLYAITRYEYSRLVWLIRVFVSSYGHNNAELTISNLYHGSWYSLADIDDTLWGLILSGHHSICGVRFVPYYANGENINSRSTSYVTGFNSMAKGEPLDGSVSGLGINAPYTDEFIDYALASYAAIGTDDSEGARGGNPTIALGNIGEYGNNSFKLKYIDVDYHTHWYNSLSEWAADGNFIQSNAYQKNGTDSTVWKTEVLPDSDYHYIYYRQHLNTDILLSKELCRKYLLSQAAYLGGYFSDNYSTVVGGELNSTDMYLGIIEPDGMTAGRYQRGAEIVPPDIDDPWTDIDFIPPEPDPDPNEYDDNNETILNNVKILPEFCTRYALTRVQLKHAHNFLCTQIAANTDSDYWSAQKLYVNNPLDVVQSVMLFPFDISNFQTDEPSYEELTFGQLVDSGYNVQINREQYCVINMGECVYYPTFGNSIDDFRNYPPYSSATLYIPYCGSVEIDPNLYMGHTIGVKIIVDMATGGCLALILRDKLVVDSISGTMGVTVPISGIQTQTLAAAERQAESQLKTARNSAIKQFAKGVGSIVAAPVAGGVVGAVAMTAYQTTVGDITQAKDTITKAQFNLEHINVPYKTIGTATSTTSFANERKCRLIVRRPVMMNFNSEKYAHNTGYACLKTGVVSDFTGYTEFQTVDLSGISATSQEKTQLFKLLQGGVFL